MKVFATVGTHTQQFDRLLRELDKIAEKKKFKVFAQTGNSNYSPKNFKSEKFLTREKTLQLMHNADLIIIQAGAGSIIDACKAGKPLIVVPRLQEFNEHTNNHQLELAKAIEEAGKGICVVEMEKLEKAVEKAVKLGHESNEKNKIAERIKEFIERHENGT